MQPYGMVILDGNSEIGGHVRSNLFYLTCLRHLIKSRAVTNRIFCPKDLFSFMRAQYGLSYHQYNYQCSLVNIFCGIGTVVSTVEQNLPIMIKDRWDHGTYISW